MARWQLTIIGKGIRQASVEKLAKKMQEEFGKDANISVRDATPPDGRAERFAEAIGHISEGRSEIESLRDELQDWKDGLPENLQSGSKADELDEAISILEDLVSNLEDQENADVTFPGMFG